MPSHILRMIRRKVYKPVKRTLKRVSSSPPNPNRNPEFKGLKSAQYASGVFAVHKNRVTAEALRTMGPVAEVDQRRVIGKGWRVIDAERVEVLLFDDGKWDVSEVWRRVKMGKKAGRGAGEGAVKTSGTVEGAGGLGVPAQATEGTPASVGEAGKAAMEVDRSRSKGKEWEADASKPVVLDHGGKHRANQFADQEPAQAD